MQKYSLPKSRLELEGNTLKKFSSQDVVIASIDVSEIEEASIQKGVEPAAIILFLGAITGVVYSIMFMEEGWIKYSAIAGLAMVSFLMFFGILKYTLVIKLANDSLEVVITDLPDEGQAFLMMLNQQRGQEA